MDRLVINPRSWHCQVRNWTYSVRKVRPPEQDNLCHYVQTVFVFAPLLFLFHAYTRFKVVLIHLLMLVIGIIALASSFWQPVLVSGETIISFITGVIGYYLIVLTILHRMYVRKEPEFVEAFALWIGAVLASFIGIMVGYATVPEWVKVGTTIPLWWMSLVVFVSPIVVALAIALVFLFLAIIAEAVHLVNFTTERAFNQKPSIDTRMVSLLWSYLKAQKNRFCPTLSIPIDSVSK